MKNPILFLFSVLLVMFLASCSSETDLTPSSGPEPGVPPSDAIQINSFDDLLAMANDKANYGKSYILMVNIRLPDEPWTPIGDLENPFTGNFDGNGHTISNIVVNGPNKAYQGFFGFITPTAVIKNLGVFDFDITGLGSVGAIAGSNEGKISNCYSIDGTVTTGHRYAGGIVGINNGHISNCYSSSNVVATNGGYAGGIAGQNLNDISTSYSTGVITASKYAGGIAGANEEDQGTIREDEPVRSFTITNCVALNNEIDVSEDFEGRVVGNNAAGGTLAGNYAYNGMSIIGADSDDDINGAEVSKETAKTAAFWSDTMNFDESVWDLDLDSAERVYKLPWLKNMENQPETLPDYLE